MQKYPAFSMSRYESRKIVLLGVLVALQTIFSNTLGIRTPIMKISFGFFPLILAAMLLGPFYAAIGASLADIIGFFLFQTGTFFPGYTLSAFLSGLVYGFFLYGRPVKLWRVIVSVSIVKLILHLGLNTYWTYIAFVKNGFWALFLKRVVPEFLQIPIQVVFICLLASRICAAFPEFPANKSADAK